MRLMAPDSQPDVQHESVVSARQADYASANKQLLGTCRFLGVGPRWAICHDICQKISFTLSA